ncbi:HoxN/HupN/NixA family nickel/cobalt transporter [Roseococcus sp. YIM B11640]|uniref:HoxN/HupN/NixA family nickel/cobalt transporter n=1 Tax=Roseococcus sp. YIM B11640 TaxID=3133973 RepID=UPI003C7DF1DB
MILNPFDDRPERSRTKIALVYILLLAANLAAWAWAWVAFSHSPTLMGTAFLAYMLGLRHAFDADHIAAIDNVVRKLVQQGKAPHTAGLFFSLGHSSIVVIASAILAATAAAMQDELAEFHEIGGIIGTVISAGFLLLIGFANLLILRRIWAAFRRARQGEHVAEEELEAVLSGRGLLSRLFRRAFGLVSRSWHLYPVGFLFGLGFDTATEIGLLGIAAAQGAQGMPIWTILVFPALFTAGMTLMDTTDSVLMTGAYGWASVHPVRKLWYNLTLTAASVAVALFIGGLGALGLIAEKLGLEGGIWDFVSELNENLGQLGYAVVAIFLISWVVSVLVYRLRGYDRIGVAETP